MNNYINKILSATWYPDICKNHNDYKVLARYLHPDLTNDSHAAIALSHLNNLKADFENGFEFNDESGEFRSNYIDHCWSGNYDLLKTSKLNYDKIVFTAKSNFDGKSFIHFMQYMPSNLNFDNKKLIYKSRYRSIPLSKVIRLLPDKDKNKHVNWIYSRLVEYVVMLESLGITHAGINPDSVFIIPEIHGIKVISFYHVCTEKVKTITSKYKNYYPSTMFDTKEAGSYVDLSLIKKTAICALGDTSGSGVKLRGEEDINQNVLNYLMLPENNAFSSMRAWRDILNHNFIKEFVELKI